MVRVTDFAQSVLGKCKESTGLQYSESFGKKHVAVGYIHRDVLRVTAIKCFIAIWKLLAVTVPTVHLAIHTDKRTKLIGGIDEWSRDVYSIYMTVETLGKIPSGATDPTTDVDKPIPLAYR